ncbi:Zinc finger, C2H2 [Penicillium italicum]|uniref:Zinc finger, C2H2 n=1 Tax=Penicillium italicum TaxID=40296 RepID=A0A0A2LCJ6_PENIT|nr:Zinc finger, C2H2 [Penicillium italicum]
MSTFKKPHTACTMPPFDLEYATFTPLTLVNHNSQLQMYPNPVNVSLRPQPSSHRVSKAMKGKRVHACEHPGCSKVFTRAEHRRRHELSHEPKMQYPCTYEGCQKAFHRPDYLAQHLGRHATSEPKEKTSHARSNTSNHRPSLQQEMQSQPANSPIQFQPDSTDNYPRVWGSIDSSMSCPPYVRGQSQSSASVDDHPSPYSYTNDICSSPVPSDSFANPQYPTSGMPMEMVTAIDQYLRSILKPEAFSSPHQQMSPAIWNSDIDIDPTLTKIKSPDQLPLYSWHPTHHFQYEDHPVPMNHPSNNQ